MCETVTRKVELNNDPTYDYQPPHYYEVFCKSYSLMDDEPQAKADAAAAASVVPSKQVHSSHHSNRSSMLYAYYIDLEFKKKSNLFVLLFETSFLEATFTSGYFH